MVLDPQAEAFLAQMAALGAPPLHELTPADARVAAAAFAQFGGPPEDVGSVDHRFIPGPTADLPVRIYRPAGITPGQVLPALVYFHGSGWVILNVEIFDSVLRALCNRTGCVVIAVNYQKAPEHKFPIPFDDCYATTKWAFENAEQLGIDTTRIGVAGDSAGGNLAAAVALKARDESGPELACQLLVYPVTQYGWDTPSYHDNAQGYVLERATMEWFWTNYVHSATDAANPYCAPMSAHDHSGLPPTLIITAQFDPLRDDGTLYANKLEAAGVRVKLHNYEGMLHGFFQMPGVFDQSKALLDELGKEVRGLLG